MTCLLPPLPQLRSRQRARCGLHPPRVESGIPPDKPALYPAPTAARALLLNASYVAALKDAGCAPTTQQLQGQPAQGSLLALSARARRVDVAARLPCACMPGRVLLASTMAETLIFVSALHCALGRCRWAVGCCMACHFISECHAPR